VSRPRPILRRLAGYASVLLVWPIFIGISLTLTSYLVGISLDATKSLPSVKHFLIVLLPLLLTTVAFAWLYFKIPNRAVRFSHALIGGLVAAILFELMKRGFAAYVTNFPAYKLIYGAFASLPVFLLWLYLSWIVILLGAEIAASLHYLEGGAWKASSGPEQRLYDTLRVLRAMYSAHRNGKRYLGPKELQALIPLGLDRLENMMAELAGAGIIRPLAGSQHYALSRTNEILLADIYRLVVLDNAKGKLALKPADSQLQVIMGKIRDDREKNQTMTLEEIFSAMPLAEAGQWPDSSLGEFK
jgi:membrane protein